MLPWKEKMMEEKTKVKNYLYDKIKEHPEVKQAIIELKLNDMSKQDLWDLIMEIAEKNNWIEQSYGGVTVLHYWKE